MEGRKISLHWFCWNATRKAMLHSNNGVLLSEGYQQRQNKVYTQPPHNKILIQASSITAHLLKQIVFRESRFNEFRMQRLFLSIVLVWY